MKYHIRFEAVGGVYYYMIYSTHWLFGSKLFEKWDSAYSAVVRAKELEEK